MRHYSDAVIHMSRTQAEHLTCMATKFELDFKHAQSQFFLIPSSETCETQKICREGETACSLRLSRQNLVLMIEFFTTES